MMHSFHQGEILDCPTLCGGTKVFVALHPVQVSFFEGGERDCNTMTMTVSLSHSCSWIHQRAPEKLHLTSATRRALMERQAAGIMGS
ncbi:hypothetical protein SKAU_G00105910 [Synaphobranchus kaupii]|uniref:Uncharacterized protein n=1 Tax=Synaphobranchus kaupii TaxID=118154 RepID=A0A9Q1J7X6_SYNKA|nr:hypothetical protein SKAU_G00105910 [Synaphobranchus kaupii]